MSSLSQKGFYVATRILCRNNSSARVKDQKKKSIVTKRKLCRDKVAEEPKKSCCDKVEMLKVKMLVATKQFMS